jgi:hypothetical protein
MAKVNLHVIQCFLCRNLIEVRPPSKQYELILSEPCPMCNGLAQSLDCDNCLQKNTIYWDERHFASHSMIILYPFHFRTTIRTCYFFVF